jgi:O-antigen/teichoic acid export membrane protein
VGKISNIANIEFGTIIVAMFVGREEIGLFAVASSLVVRAEMIPNTLATVILPRIARDGDGRPELVAQCARATTVLCGILLAVLALFTTPIVAILFSPAFLPAVPLIRIMAFGTLVRCASKVVVPYLVLRNRPGLASVAVFSGMIVNFATLLALLPGLGLSAAALAVTLNHMCSGAILLTSFHNISGVRPAEFWRFRRSDWESLTRKMGWKQEAGEIADAARAGGGGRA